MPFILNIQGAPATYPAKVTVTVDTGGTWVTNFRAVRIIVKHDGIESEQSFLLLAGLNAGGVVNKFESIFTTFFPFLNTSVLNNVLHIQAKNPGGVPSVINYIKIALKGEIEPGDPPGWVVWPTNLPRCATSWGEVPVDPRVRTSMDVGRAKTRRRTTKLERRIKVTFNLHGNGSGPNNEMIALRTFFETPGNTTTHQGGTDGGYSWFLFQSPVDKQFHFYRFVSPPQFANDGPMAFIGTMEWEEFL